MRSIHIFVIFVLLVFFWATPTETAFKLTDPFGLGGDGEVSILNTHTKEFETIKYRDGVSYLPEGLAKIRLIFRCRLTQSEVDIPIKLIELLDSIEDHFQSGHIELVSGYRSPQLNAMLRNKSKRVARESLHMSGLAADIKVPNVGLHEVRDYVKKLAVGGVGYYARSFVHVDVGDVRHW